jgi:gluconokinase
MFIAIDIGTSSIKIILSNSNGEIVKSFRDEIPLYISQQGAAEHSPNEIYQLVLKGVKSVVKGFESSIEAIVFSTYLHGLGILDVGFNPISNILTHLDSRAGKVQGLLEEYGVELYRRTGCPPLFIYPIAKILWLQKTGGLDIKYISFLKDYLIYRFTSQKFFTVDYGVASGSGLLNIYSLRWDDYALGVAGVDEKMLPEVVEGAKVLEYMSFPEIGLRDKVALVLGSFDGALQNVGYSIYGDEAILNLGSTAVLRILSRDVILDRDRRMRFFCYYAADGYRVVGAASNNGMTALEWFRRVFIDNIEWSVINSIVEDVELCSNNVVVLPFVAGERFPYRSPYLSYIVIGLGLAHEKKHVVRASLEGIAFVLKAIAKALEENGLSFTVAHCAGGGCSIESLVKIVSQSLCKSIVIYDDNIARNASSLGGVVVAMKALGYGDSISKILLDSIARSKAKVVEPSKNLCLIYDKCFNRFEKLVENIIEMLSPNGDKE